MKVIKDGFNDLLEAEKAVKAAEKRIEYAREHLKEAQDRSTAITTTIRGAVRDMGLLSGVYHIDIDDNQTGVIAVGADGRSVNVYVSKKISR